MYLPHISIEFLFFLIDTCRLYIQQLRQELGRRIVDKVYDPQTDKPSKVITSCMCFYLTIGLTFNCV